MPVSPHTSLVQLDPLVFYEPRPCVWAAEQGSPRAPQQAARCSACARSIILPGGTQRWLPAVLQC